MKKARYLLAHGLRKLASRIMPRGHAQGITYPDLGSERLPNDAPRALIIYSATGIDRYVRGVPLSDPIFNKHTIYWESVRMVQILNDAGYIVDYCDVWKPFSVDWKRYAIVIDNLNNLKDIPEELPIKKVYWATNNHWLTWNAAELQRLQWFKERTGITVPMARQLPSTLSDEYADHLTYFGTALQRASFSQRPRGHCIPISSCVLPPYKKKDLSVARNKFIWMGGGGLVHKGLDIVLEAFARMPHAELYVVGNMQEEPRFWQWAQPLIATHANIHPLGWMDLTSKEFCDIADQCIATVYASAAEGGPGTIARLLHHGTIPIVTPESFVRAEVHGFQINGSTDQEMIASTMRLAEMVMRMPDGELHDASEKVRAFAKDNHTRHAFEKSFASFIKEIM